MIDLGRFNVIRGCGAGGIDDDFFCATDVYILRASQVPPIGSPLVDVSGSANPVIGPAPDCAILSETIGHTGVGSLLNGDYAIIYDECQDGILDSEDFVLNPAFRINMPVVIEPPPIAPAILAAKRQAQNEAAQWLDALVGMQTIFFVTEAQSLLGAVVNWPAALSACVAGDGSACRTIVDILFFAVKFGTEKATGVSPRNITTNTLLNVVRHYQAIADDPPDPNYRRLAVMDSVPRTEAEDVAPFELALGGLGNSVLRLDALGLGALTSIERYSGAANASDEVWALVHATQLEGYGRILERETASAALVIDEFSRTLASEYPSLDGSVSALASFQTELRANGVPAAIMDSVAAWGFSQAKLEATLEEISAVPTTGFSLAGFRERLDSLALTCAAGSQAWHAASESCATIAARLVAEGTPDRYPRARPGGPYSGAQGGDVLLDGTASTDPDGLISQWHWDTDMDGEFDDGSGGVLTISLPGAGRSLIGLAVNDNAGNQGVAYTALEVTQQNSPPLITGATPSGFRTTTRLGSPAVFGVSVRDEEGDPLLITWKLDGHFLADGADCTYLPLDPSELGLHFLRAEVRQGGPLASQPAVREWGIAVEDTPNAAPIAVDDTIYTFEDAPHSVGVSALLKNDADPDGNPLSFGGVFASSNGTASVVDTTIRFVPLPDADCPGSFHYALRDPRGASDTARVVVLVVPTNDAPLAAPDFAQTPRGRSLTIEACVLLANDYDPDSSCALPSGPCAGSVTGGPGACLETCDTLAVLAVIPTQETHGTVELSGVQVTYTPSFGFVGQARILYTVGDGHGGQADGEWFVSVTPEAAMPDLVIRSVEGDESENCADPRANGTARATIANVGEAAAGTPFEVQFFQDRNRNGSFETGTDLDLGLGMVAGQLLVGQDVQVSIAMDAVVEFAGAPISAICDASNAVPEADESNNSASSGLACRFTPSVGGFDPVVEWHWGQSAVQPDALNVMSTPGVMDLDGDGTPEVVFGSTVNQGGAEVVEGFLRALRGSNGSEYFTVTNPSHLVNTASSVALGNIDADPLPEIIACHSSGDRLIAFENDGTFKWLSVPLERVNLGAPALADLDHDGVPEIVLGRQALNADGSLRWTGSGGRGAGEEALGSLAIVADINLDGSPEIVAGNTAYAATGAQLWQAACPDGYDAVGNFDTDRFPEIVLVGAGALYLLEADGTIRWGPVAIPGGGRGGPPTIADFDGDGHPEIGVAGATRYAVFEGDGTVKWTSPIQDGTSNITGSSVFDFDGDESAEVVYRDELKLRIYRGSDGTVLFEVPMSSCTWYEYVLVADVDADGNAELVAVANNNCGFGPQRGVYVFGDQNDSWVACRKVWNQFGYHITNINDDGSVPQFEHNSWLYPSASPYNSYRQNLFIEGSPLAAPDVTASVLRFDLSGCPDSAVVTARIGNGGSRLVPRGLTVALYDGNPGAGGSLTDTTHTHTELAPGAYEDVTLSLRSLSLPGRNAWVVADDNGAGVGTLKECREDNNSCSVTLECKTNEPPECAGTFAPDSVLWPPNHEFRGVAVMGVTDPDGDATSIRFTGVTQDEPVDSRGDGATCPDARFTEASAQVRSERTGRPGAPGNGRVYWVRFVALDSKGDSCAGAVRVCVPHDQDKRSCIDDGQSFNSINAACRASALEARPAQSDLRVLRLVGGELAYQVTLPGPARVQIALFDVAGRRLATLEDSDLEAGSYTRALQVSQRSAGLYFLRMSAGPTELTRPVLVLR